jgi:hypothetical protein
MRCARLVIAFCSVWMLSGSIHAQVLTPKVVPLEVTIDREPVDYSDPFYRANISTGTIKCSLLVPQGFRLKGDPSLGKLILSNLGGDSSVSFGLLGPLPEGSSELSAEYYRAVVAKQYPNAKILKEFTKLVSGRMGPGFDIQWKATEELYQNKRIVFIPSGAGVLEFTVTGGNRDFSVAQGNLDSVMGSFCYCTSGKLKIRYLSNAGS